MKKKRMPAVCIVLYILAVLSLAGGIYCYVTNVGNCHIARDGDTWSIMDNLTDPFSFEAGLLWDLAIVMAVVSYLIGLFAPAPAPKPKKESKYINYGDEPLAAALGNAQVTCKFGAVFLALAWALIIVFALRSILEYGLKFGFEYTLPFLALGVVLSLFFGILLHIIRKDIKLIKKEIAKRIKTPEDAARFQSSSKSSGKRLLVIIALLIVGAIVLGLALGNSITSSGNTGKCCICSKPATNRFQGSEYCGRHYADAIIWAMDHVNN